MNKNFNEIKRKKLTVTLTEQDEDIYNFFVNKKNASALVRRLILTYMLRPVEMEMLMRGESLHNVELFPKVIEDTVNKTDKNFFEITEEEKLLDKEVTILAVDDRENRTSNIIYADDIKAKAKLLKGLMLGY